MISKLIRFGLVAALLAAVLLMAAPAKAESCGDHWVPWALPSPVFDSADSCMIIHFSSGWIATTPGLVKEYIGAISYEKFTLQKVGGPLIYNYESNKAFDLWLKPMALSPQDSGLVSPMPNLWMSYWEVTPQLNPGNYVFHYEVTLRHPVNDGYHVVVDPTTGTKMSTPPSLYQPADAAIDSTVYLTVK